MPDGRTRKESPLPVQREIREEEPLQVAAAFSLPLKGAAGAAALPLGVENMDPITLNPPGSDAGAMAFKEVSNDDGSKSWVLDLKASIDGKPVEAELQQGGAFAAIADIEVGGLNLGTPLLGGGAAIIVTEVIDGVLGAVSAGGIGGIAFSEPVPAAIIKGLAALAVNSDPVKDVIGRDGAQFGAELIVFDAIRTLLPIDTTIRDLIGRLFSGVGGGGGGASTADALNAGRIVEGALDPIVAGRLQLAGL